MGTSSVRASLCLTLALGACTAVDNPNLASSGSGTETFDPTTSESATTSGSATTDDGCVEQPPECANFVACIGALDPEQAQLLENQYGPEGSCWCEGVDAANTCYTTCLVQLDAALDTMAGQQELACHEESCTIDELDPNEPYGPIIHGSCPDYTEDGQSIPQSPNVADFPGVPGGFCSPTCTDAPNPTAACPGHVQTGAAGTCFGGDPGVCALHCWVDPRESYGAQCHCGARCQPMGAADGEGNLRGICTFQ